MIPTASTVDTQLDFSDFPAVTLDELVNEAALLKRFDRKYLVPTDAAATIIRSLDPRTRVLEIDRRRSFSYDSVYFDTPDHLAYRLTAQRRRRRFKLRTRTYVDTGGSFLEVKTKDGRGSTVKSRIATPPQDRARLTPQGRTFAAAMLAEHGHDRALLDQLRPSIVSRYQRTTLLLPCSSRATIDTDLHWIGPDEREFSMHDHVIIESKTIHRVSELDRALWVAGFRPTGISKFGVGTAALNPGLPRNKWARVFAGTNAPKTSELQ